MLTRTLKMAFWVVYDHLGKLLAVNVLCMAVLLAPIGMAYVAAKAGGPWVAGVALGAAALSMLTWLSMAAAGTAHMIKELIDTREGSIGAFFVGVRRWGWRATGLGAILSWMSACLIAGIWFYAVRMGQSMPLAGYALSGISLWALIFVWLMGLMAVPALIQKGQGVAATLKLSALLVLDNPLFCLGLGLWVGLCLCAALIPLALICASLAPVMTLVSSAYEILARKYAAIEHAGREGWKRLPAAEVFHDAGDEYLNRGFRDFLFPWQS